MRRFCGVLVPAGTRVLRLLPQQYEHQMQFRNGVIEFVSTPDIRHISDSNQTAIDTTWGTQ